MEANTDDGDVANDGTALLKEASLGSPFLGTVKVNDVFLRETFSSWSRFKSSLRCRFSVSALKFLASSSATLSSS